MFHSKILAARSKCSNCSCEYFDKRWSKTHFKNLLTILRKKRLYIIHNFSTICTEEDMKKQINKDILNVFEVDNIVYPDKLAEN